MLRFSLLSLVAAWVLGSANVTLAQCVESPADTVTCASDDTDGFREKDRDDIAITVNSGVLVTNGDEAVRTDDDLTLVNSGTIRSTGNDGVQADNDAVITNNGTIESTAADGDDGIQVGNDATIDNTGTVIGTKDGINAENGVTITNESGALIEGGDEGIQGEEGLTVTNRGTIRSGDKGIDTEGFDNLTVTNEGLIESDDKGIRAGADDDGNGGNGFQLDNSGTIDARDEGVEAGDGAVITNSGTIESADDDAVQVGENADITITETGAVRSDGGDGIDVDSGTIENDGEIVTSAAGEAGIDVDQGDSQLEVINRGVIEGEFGILVENGLTDPDEDPENVQTQIVRNSGRITGTGGTALSLWAGNDTVELFDGSVIEGAADFGSGDDLLSFFGADLFFDDLFDGGEDTDHVDFGDLLFADLDRLGFDGSAFDLSYDDGEFRWQLGLANWESFSFADREFASAREFAAASFGQVPAPGMPALLVAGVLALLGSRHARRPRPERVAA